MTGRHCFPLLFLLAVLFFHPVLKAQTIVFLPESASSITYDGDTFKFDAYHKAGEDKHNYLERKLDHAGLSSTQVTGNITEKLNRHFLTYGYGLSRDWNLNLRFSQIDRERRSAIRAATGDTAASTFVSNFKSSSNSGQGDSRFWASWRWAHSDENIVQTGLGVDWNDGEYIYDATERLNLGSGANEILYFFRWNYYSSSSRYHFELNYENLTTIEGRVRNANGGDVEIRRPNDQRVHLLFATETASIDWGLRFLVEDKAHTIVDNMDQNDGWLLYTYRVHLGSGNLTALERGETSLPMEWVLFFENSILGIGGPAGRRYGVSGSLYF